MNYNESMEFINSTAKITSLGLTTITKLLDIMGNPEKNLKIIHVAGTNGKGSTVSFITQMLMELNYNVGMYTSPFLEEFNERIQINKKNIADDELAAALTKTKVAIEQLVQEGGAYPTEFEVMTATAYQYFKDKKVDFLVLEVGLGGDLDATNTCHPILSVITSISLDHVELLGNSIEEIAQTKAGIIKKEAPVVLYQQEDIVQQVIRKKSLIQNSPLYVADFEIINIHKQSIKTQEFSVISKGQLIENIALSMLGDHQIKNFVTALLAIQVLNEYGYIPEISIQQIRQAAVDSKWIGRTEVILESPLTILDGAHNVDGSRVLSAYIQKYLCNKKIILVLGMLRDKDIDGVAAQLVPLVNDIVITKPNNNRAASKEEIAPFIERYARENQKWIFKETIHEAVMYAQKLATSESYMNQETVLYAGSLYMIGDVRKLLLKEM